MTYTDTLWDHGMNEKAPDQNKRWDVNPMVTTKHIRHKLLYESEVIDKSKQFAINNLFAHAAQARRDSRASGTEEQRHEALREAVMNLGCVALIYRDAEITSHRWEGELSDAFRNGEIKEDGYHKDLETISKVTSEAREAYLRVERMEARLMSRMKDEDEQNRVTRRPFPFFRRRNQY